jgi:hypothetical protein
MHALSNTHTHTHTHTQELLSNPTYNALLKSMRAIGNQVVGGPQEGPQNYQKGMSLYQAIGSANVFATANFNGTNHMLMATIGGVVIQPTEAFISTEDALKIKNTAATDPVACIKFLFTFVLAMFRDLFGFDMTTYQPIQGGGLFGTMEDLVANHDSNHRSMLHLHFLCWFQGKVYISGRF